jgi:long-chain-fatty-acid--[acyl-carrier-protein] ligase
VILDTMLEQFVKFALSLRYRVRVRGLQEVARRGRRGILFLPNHPALIDPVIILSRLWRWFAPRALADREQTERFFVRFLARRTNVLPIDDLAQGGDPAGVRAAINACAAALRQGENVLLYPSGRVYRSRAERLGNSRAAHTVLQQVPDARVVLVRTTGLWGSGFSHAFGEPDLGTLFRRGLVGQLASAWVFAPRREVTIELCEPRDLPRAGDRAVLNRYLEAFYRGAERARRYVPYSCWEPVSGEPSSPA